MELFGWDTAYAAGIDVINRSLEASTARLPTSFSFEQQGVTASGRFGAWSIAPGSSGALLLLRIPIASGQMTFTGAPPIDVSGVAVILKVTLTLLPAPAGGGQQLVFNFKQAESHAAGDADGLVVPSSVEPADKLTLLQQSALGMAVATSLVQNSAQVAFVFATLDPLAFSQMSWMRPVQSAYAFGQTGGGAAALAILSVTTHRDISGLDRRIDPGLLGAPGTLAVAISGPLFLQNIMIPALQECFHQGPGTFAVGGDGIVRNTRRFGLPSVSKAGETYYPGVSSLSARIADNHVIIDLSGDCDMHMNISMDFGAESILSASVGAGGKLTFAPVGSPTFHKDVHIPWYDHLLAVVGLIAEIILQVTVAAIGSELADGIQQVSSVSQLGGLSQGVTWSGAHSFTVNQGGLATAFYLRGTPG